MRFYSIVLFFFYFFLSPIKGHSTSIPSDDSVTLIRLIKTGDSIVTSHVGKNVFEDYYRFAPEYSLIKRDTLGNHLACSWLYNNIGRGTSYELTYALKGNTFAAEGIHIYLNRNGSEYYKSLIYPIIPKSVNGESPNFITRKEVFSIAEQYGMKDTFALSCELVILLQKETGNYVYRLKITFDTKSNHKDDTTGNDYFILNTLMVNPWSNKVISHKKEEVVLTPIMPWIEIEQKPEY